MPNDNNEEGLDFSHSFDQTTASATSTDESQALITTEIPKRSSKKKLFILIGILMLLALVQLFLLYYKSGANPKTKKPIPPEGLRILPKNKAR
jgi:hypothetical protein